MKCNHHLMRHTKVTKCYIMSKIMAHSSFITSLASKRWVLMGNMRSRQSTWFQLVIMKRAWKMHFQPPKNEMKCVLCIKESYSKGKKCQHLCEYTFSVWLDLMCPSPCPLNLDDFPLFYTLHSSSRTRVRAVWTSVDICWYFSNPLIGLRQPAAGKWWWW